MGNNWERTAVGPERKLLRLISLITLWQELAACSDVTDHDWQEHYVNLKFMH